MSRLSQTSLPETSFKNNSAPELTIEIMRLSSLYERFNRPFPIEQLQFHLLLLFTQGEGTHMVDFQDYPFRTGTLLKVMKGQVQQLSSHLQGEGWMVLFTEEFLLSAPTPHLPAWPDGVCSSPALQLPTLAFEQAVNWIRLMHGEFTHQPTDPYTAPVLRHLLLGLLFAVERHEPTPPANRPIHLQEFYKFSKLIETHSTTTRQVASYAEKLGYSAKKLNYLCQAAAGCSAKEMINVRVVLEAKRLLAGTNQSIKEVAYGLGFEEPTNLTKFFRRYTHKTPEEFRASLG